MTITNSKSKPVEKKAEEPKKSKKNMPMEMV